MTLSEEKKNPVRTAADEIAQKLDADILFISGEMTFGLDETVIDLVRGRRRRKNVVLVLVTYGGFPDPAYRVARTLQEKYEKFYAFVTGTCKSAGTLLVIGANEVVMSDYGDLGPLDIQALKDDELGQMSSGLTTQFAFEELRHETMIMFERIWRDIKRKSYNRISFRTATEIATNMTVGLMSPIYGQIGPLSMGEIGRANNITRDYGERLAKVSENMKDDAVDKLTDSYAHHGFVIDRAEAAGLFHNVREPDAAECRFFDALGKQGRQPYSKPGIEREDPMVLFFSEEVAEAAADQEGAQIDQANDRKNDENGHDAANTDDGNAPVGAERTAVSGETGTNAGANGTVPAAARSRRNGSPAK